MKETLVGKKISVFMDGGWEFEGTVKIQDDEKLIIESDGKFHMIFRKKVSVLSIAISDSAIENNSNTKVTAAPVEVEPTIDDMPEYEEESEVLGNLFPINPISYDESSMSIPMDVLGIKNHKDEDDFSVSFSGTSKEEVAQSKGRPKISFRTEDE